MSVRIRQDNEVMRGTKMTESAMSIRSKEPKHASPPLRVSVPVKATFRTDAGLKELEGRLESLGEGHGRISFDHPLEQSTELSLLIEFKDRRNREIRFHYDGKVTSRTCALWYEVDVAFEEGVAISGKDAREILSDLFPEEA